MLRPFEPGDTITFTNRDGNPTRGILQRQAWVVAWGGDQGIGVQYATVDEKDMELDNPVIEAGITLRLTPGEFDELVRMDESTVGSLTRQIIDQCKALKAGWRHLV